MSSEYHLEYFNHLLTHYIPEQGFEEKQAYIYNTMVRMYNGEETTAQKIKDRIKRDKPDDNGIRFALKEDEGRAYIQYRSYPKSNNLWIGYPWAVPGTPSEIQDKLFDDLLEYIKGKFPDYTIYLGYVRDDYQLVHDFVKAKGFQVVNKNSTYQIPTKIFKQISYDQNYLSKIADKTDLDQLIAFAKSNEGFMSYHTDYVAMQSFFTDKIIPENETILLQDQNGTIQATGALATHEDTRKTRLQFRIVAENNYAAFSQLLKELIQRQEQSTGNLDILHVSVYQSDGYPFQYFENLIMWGVSPERTSIKYQLLT